MVSKVIDFDSIYRNVFERAINEVELPEGGKLVARRADQDVFTGLISREMFRYIEYSRFAVADLTGLNPNVFFELGHRYRARPSGTAVFRLPDVPIPFDTRDIKALDYEYRPDERAEESRQLITRVLTESLILNRIDSPIQAALDDQLGGGDPLERILLNAENAIRAQDWSAARQYFGRALALQPNNGLLHFKAGAMWRLQARWREAVSEFEAAVKVSPEFAEAHRELGIARNKLHAKTNEGLDGIAALERAVRLNPEDFDALSSLGGAMRRAGRNAEALALYRDATRVSLGHPYPLLNELKLEVIVNGRTDVFSDRKLQLRRAEVFRRGQTSHVPAIDSPWSFFDLAEIRLYLGDRSGFLETIDRGLLQPLTRAWEARTFRETLELLATSLAGRGTPLPNGLAEGINLLRVAEPQLLE